MTSSCWSWLCASAAACIRLRDGAELVAYLKCEPPFNAGHTHPPNVILMDLKMPRMTGFEVLQWLRNNPQCSIIPVIIMSSSSLDSDVLAAYRLGANAYFEKPTNFQELQDILRSILVFWTHAIRPPVTKFPC